VIYTDECSVEQETAGQQRWDFSTPGQERWHVDCVNPVKHRQMKLMVWVCFWGKQRGSLVPLHDDRLRHRPCTYTEAYCVAGCF